MPRDDHSTSPPAPCPQRAGLLRRTGPLGALTLALGVASPSLARAEGAPPVTTVAGQEPPSAAPRPGDAPGKEAIKERPDPHGADAPRREPRAERWDAWGEARLRALFAAKTGELDQGGWWMTRLVAGGRYSPGDGLKFELEVEALSGFLAGDRTRAGVSLTPRPFPVARDGTSDLSRVLPRKASVAWTTRIGQLSAGAQTFTWGTGMLANDGAGDTTFGDPWLGNVVARLAFATRPFSQGGGAPLARSLAFFVAGDWVLRDDNASIHDGDRAYAGLIGARAQHDGDAFGLLLVARHQVDREDPLRPDGERAKTTVFVLDAHGKATWPAATKGRLGVEAEGVAVLGRTTRPWSDATWEDGASVGQIGAVGRVRWDDDALRLTATLEGGYASGDNDPRDGVARTFTMHTDHNVGLVLFEHLLPLLSARGVDRLADPGLLAQAPPGLRFAINPGAVQNAAYAHPTLRFRPLTPLDLRLGYLFAVPAADIVDAYQTGIRGGYAASYGGKVQSRGAYGHEIDARATWELSLPGALRLRAGGEGGVLIPGAAFDGVAGVRPDGGRKQAVWLGRAMLSLFW